MTSSAPLMSNAVTSTSLTPLVPRAWRISSRRKTLSIWVVPTTTREPSVRSGITMCSLQNSGVRRCRSLASKPPSRPLERSMRSKGIPASSATAAMTPASSTPCSISMSARRLPVVALMTSWALVSRSAVMTFRESRSRPQLGAGPVDGVEGFVDLADGRPDARCRAGPDRDLDRRIGDQLGRGLSEGPLVGGHGRERREGSLRLVNAVTLDDFGAPGGRVRANAALGGRRRRVSWARHRPPQAGSECHRCCTWPRLFLLFLRRCP